MNRLPIVLAAALACAGATAAAQNWDFGERNVPSAEPAFANQTRAPQIADDRPLRIETFAGGLENPWGIAALPEGRYLVTERPGRLRLVAADGSVGAPIAGVPKVLAERQGGLLDVAVGPDFAATGHLYLSYSKPVRGGSATAALRARLSPDGTRLEDVTDIFVQAPGVRPELHYGSRVIVTGSHIFITTGDRGRTPDYAQDLAKPFGKVIRIAVDGSVPPDNPFVASGDAAALVWSYGHRNLQGAAIHPETGDLWTLEHGPAGGDELNRIQPGTNYGWPLVSYGENYSGAPVGDGALRAEGIAEPVYYWDPVIAPGGFVFYDGALFPDWQGNVIAASLNPGGIVRLTLDGDRVTGEARYLYAEARIRDIEVAPDGAILALVDDTDGMILRIAPGGG
jgi:glucose/arabinose dehydrogenase